MKIYDSKIEVGTGIFLSHVVDIVYSHDFLKKVYGENVKISEWNNDKARLIEFERPLNDKLPRFIKRFVHKEKVDVSVEQKILLESTTEHEMKNQIRFQVFGSHLFDMQSCSKTTCCVDNNKCEINVHVKVNCHLPPFLKGKVETILLNEAIKDLTSFSKCIKDVCW
jgi:hypothetical protein